MSFSVRSRNRSSDTRTCSTCIHDGCCEGLPHCGGSCWQNAYGECANCGKQVHLEMAHEDGDEIFCSEECAIEYRNNHEEEDEEDGD